MDITLKYVPSNSATTFPSFTITAESTTFRAVHGALVSASGTKC